MDKSRSMRHIAMLVAALALVTLACTCGPLAGLLPGGGGGGSVPNTLDGGDGLDTTGGGSLSVGSSAQGTLDSLFEAHNWTFQGQAGQTVTIRVNGAGDTDPRAKLLDANGNVLAEDDDGGGGWNSLIVATLPAAGAYTVRVDVFTGGTYTISIE